MKSTCLTLHLIGSSLLGNRLFILMTVVMSSALNTLVSSNLSSITIVRNVKLPPQVLRSNESQGNNINVDTAHENSNDLAIVVPWGSVRSGGERELLANARLDGRRSRRHKVTQLVGSTNHKSSESSGRQLHQVDGNYTPSTLDTELLEKRGGHNSIITDKTVGVQKSTTNNAAADDGEATAHRLTAVSHNGTTSHSTKIGDNLSDSDLALAETKLALQHGRIQILRSVTHKVETGHEQNKIDEHHPVTLDGHFAFPEENAANILAVRAGLFAETFTFEVGIGLGEEKTPDDPDNWWAGAEPVQRTPAV